MRASEVKVTPIYQQLGVKRVINCVSTTSPLGSSVVDPQVMNAMNAASKHFVVLDDLQNKAGGIIASFFSIPVIFFGLTARVFGFSGKKKDFKAPGACTG